MKLRAPIFNEEKRFPNRMLRGQEEGSTANSAYPIRDGCRQGCQAHRTGQDRAGPHHPVRQEQTAQPNGGTNTACLALYHFSGCSPFPVHTVERTCSVSLLTNTRPPSTSPHLPSTSPHLAISSLLSPQRNCEVG